jgi:antirestriction protein ArdC
MDRTQLYADVTAEVVRQIEAGAGTWRMPWQAIADRGEPVNALTHQPYRGGNHLL